MSPEVLEGGGVQGLRAARGAGACKSGRERDVSEAAMFGFGLFLVLFCFAWCRVNSFV